MEEQRLGEVHAFGGKVAEAKRHLFGLVKGVFTFETTVPQEGQGCSRNALYVIDGKAFVFDDEDADIGVEEDQVGTWNVAPRGANLNEEGGARVVAKRFDGRDDEQGVMAMLDLLPANQGVAAREFCELRPQLLSLEVTSLHGHRTSVCLLEAFASIRRDP
jgi:hypothetical protein